MKPQSYIFIGRSGAGKGTQAKLLTDLLKIKDPSHSIIDVVTGAEFRQIIAEDKNFAAKQTKKIVENGIYMPVFMCVYAWGKLLVEKYTGSETVIFDGTPRKPEEAKMLDAVFPFFEMERPWVIYLDIDHDESTKRLTLRKETEGRVDDSPEGIEHRRQAFEADVKPTVEWYRTNPNVKFLDVDGQRPIDVIHADIVKRIGLE